MNNSINLIYAYDLINKSQGKIFTCKYIKKDNTERIINCRLQIKKGINGKGLKYNPLQKGLIPVYDMHKQGFRMLNLMTLKELTINNQKFVVNS